MDHLPTQEAKYAIDLLSGLFLCTYRIRNKKAEVTMDNLEHLCHAGSATVFRSEQSSRRSISQYLKLHPQLPREDVACTARFQGCRKQQLCTMMYEQEYTFVLDRRGRTLCGVKGIADPLNFLLRNQTLPCMVQYAILPYKNHLILDNIENTRVTTDLSFVVELFERYHGIATKKDVPFSGHETASFSVLERSMQEEKGEFLLDYLNPLSVILWNADQSRKNSFLELALTIWNLSYDGDKQAEKFFPRNVFRRYVKPLMEYCRTAFANVRFPIDHPEAPPEGETCMRAVEEKGIEQLELEP